jgi:hypothetical protein
MIATDRKAEERKRDSAATQLRLARVAGRSRAMDMVGV